MSGGNSEGISSSNAQRLLWAGFMAILAAGVGFSVRGAILGQWADRYGFTMTELGQITGGGFVGAGLIILAVPYEQITLLEHSACRLAGWLDHRWFDCLLHESRQARACPLDGSDVSLPDSGCALRSHARRTEVSEIGSE